VSHSLSSISAPFQYSLNQFVEICHYSPASQGPTRSGGTTRSANFCGRHRRLKICDRMLRICCSSRSSLTNIALVITRYIYILALSEIDGLVHGCL
jgi:hypothetical protein